VQFTRLSSRSLLSLVVSFVAVAEVIPARAPAQEKQIDFPALRDETVRAMIGVSADQHDESARQRARDGEVAAGLSREGGDRERDPLARAHRANDLPVLRKSSDDRVGGRGERLGYVRRHKRT
jgi:hypothetical protein